MLQAAAEIQTLQPTNGTRSANGAVVTPTIHTARPRPNRRPIRWAVEDPASTPSPPMAR